MEIINKNHEPEYLHLIDYLKVRRLFMSKYVNGLVQSKKKCSTSVLGFWTDKDERELIFAKGHKREVESILELIKLKGLEHKKNRMLIKLFNTYKR